MHTKRLPEILSIVPMKCFNESDLRAMSNGQEDIENGSNGREKFLI